MQDQSYTRKITDEFFYSEIGRTVREALYNDCTLIRKPGFILTCGEYKSNNMNIIFKLSSERPIIRTGYLWYHDNLFIDDAIIEGTVRAHIIQTYESGNGKNFVYKVERFKPFDLIWTTTVMINNDPRNTFKRKIRVIPKTVDDKE
jgi:hypothetical protein